MIPALQTVLAAASGVLLWWLWKRYIATSDLGLIVTAGFLIRAVGGQVLFWISYLQLPVFPELQIGEGLWFFAVDGRLYLNEAARAADGGLASIMWHTRTAPSITYVQTLALFTTAFGTSLSVALLINLFAFLGSSIVIVHWSKRIPGVKIAAAIALLAISLSPAMILWSMQPLKDPLFQFLVIAFIAAALAWQQAWVDARGWAAGLGAAALMFVTLFAVAGIRWYFAFAMLLASGAFLFLVAIMASRRKALALCCAAVFLILLSRAFLASGGPYISETVHRLLQPKTITSEVARVPRYLFRHVESARKGFDETGGATLIGTGKLARAAEQPPPPKVGSAPRDITKRAPSDKARSRQTPRPMAEPAAPDAAGSQQTPRPMDVEPAGEPLRIPESRGARMVTGTAAVLLPMSVAERIGFVEVRGGRGLMSFTDFDTLVFDLILIGCFLLIVPNIRQSVRNPLFWLVALTTILVAMPLVYTVSNYGTLFRLRGMIYIGVALVPLAVCTQSGANQIALPRD